MGTSGEWRAARLAQVTQRSMCPDTSVRVHGVPPTKAGVLVPPRFQPASGSPQPHSPRAVLALEGLNLPPGAFAPA